MSDYVIRLYKDSDYDVSRDLFAEGLVEHTNKAFQHAIRLPHIWLPVLAVLLLPALNLLSIAMSILMAVTAIVVVYYCSRYMYTSYIDYSLSDDMLDIRKYYLQREGYSFWVAESTSGEVMGTIAALPSSDPGGEKHLELRRLSVAKHHRGKGIGSVLCRTLIDFARKRGYEAVVLTTTLSQVNAQKMYEKLGFRHTQTLYLLGPLSKVLGFSFLAYKYDIPAA
ncbi:N-acetyltransferase 8-like isoform X2 [Hyla sarda]|uniref:N-acetyltransferase 8-like isoform X2 n=2 Tax=Hyla sarda TaxID=327740 RepID=UPI0024C34C38|nr:N-acetyltransferase 8-like isoform X2 [Hyla sarda]XP_056406080.1 N-acetyltransferase 8-like isoform X2 [Hyla sarda]